MKTNQIKNGELLPMYTLLYRELKDDSLHISVYSGEKCWLWNKRDMLFSSGVLWFCLKNQIPKLLEFFPIHSIGQNPAGYRLPWFYLLQISFQQIGHYRIWSVGDMSAGQDVSVHHAA